MAHSLVDSAASPWHQSSPASSGTALVSEDGSWTYHQLDQLSNVLAGHLLDANIQLGSSVVVCFQKPWLQSLAMLAVMKTGATVIHLDLLRLEEDDQWNSFAQDGQHLITLACSDSQSQRTASRLPRSKTIIVDTELLLHQLRYSKLPPSPPNDASPESSMLLSSSKPDGIDALQDVDVDPKSHVHVSYEQLDGTSSSGDTFSSEAGEEEDDQAQLASDSESLDASHYTHVLPFSLLPRTAAPLQDVIDQAAQLLNVDRCSVKDIMPATRLQEGLLALTSADPTKYVEDFTFDIGPDVDVARLESAWRSVAASHQILRTRLASLPILGNHCLFQVVLDEPISWHVHDDYDFDAAEMSAERPKMEVGSRLSAFTVRVSASKQRRELVWTAHHAVYDGWSQPLILSNVEKVYFNEAPIKLHPMSTFIKYLSDKDEASDRDFWKDALRDTRGHHFPENKTAKLAQPDQELLLDIQDLRWQNNGFTPSCMLRAAWAIAVASAVGSDEALFGVTVTGRQAPVEGIDVVEGPTIATVPVRVGVDWAVPVHELLASMQLQAAEMIPFEQTGLQRIAKYSPQTEAACSFQSLLVVQPAVDKNEDAAEREFLSEVVVQDGGSTGGNADSYAIVAECEQHGDALTARFAFDSTLISSDQMAFVGQTFEHALREMSADRTKQHLALLRDERWDLHQAWQLNEIVPESLERCIHDMISDQVRMNPEADAIHAWDGSFTYSELDQLSTQLALHLCEQGVTGQLIPLHFDKSKWMPIAAIAVIKAGAGCMAMDVTQPQTRLQSIVDQANAPLMLVSASKPPPGDSFSNIRKIVVSAETSSSWSAADSTSLPTVQPEDVLYANFTSGSTGVPKGAVNTHRGFASAIKHQQEYLGYKSAARVFDFASYAFDVVWCNMLHSFTCGACLCIPSQQERDNDLIGCLQKYKVTHVDLTPTVARMLGRKILNQLSTLILGGEAVLAEDVHLAGPQTDLINVYGPAECSATATMLKLTSKSKEISIGKGAGACTWVIDPETQQPSAFGAVGELWLEGPIVGAGYLNNKEKTDLAFIQDPEWLLRGLPERPGTKTAGVSGRAGTLYRTGDLVYYKPDGMLIFVGRKDLQVKIRGQRLELGEVEQHLLNVLPIEYEPSAIAEAIQLPGANSKTLISFVSLTRNAEQEFTEDEHTRTVAKMTPDILSRLAASVPAYMVPAVMIPVLHLPITGTGKIDRKALRSLGEAEYQKYKKAEAEAASEAEDTLTPTELTIKRVWMAVLNLTEQEVSTSRSFTRLGGDSITAMQIVSQCRMHNIGFTVSDLLESSTIKRLAARCAMNSSKEAQDHDSAYASASGKEEDEADRSQPFGLSPIQQMFFDTYPDGLHHWNQSFALELTRHVEPSFLQEAMTAIVERHEMLRCRFARDEASGQWTQRISEQPVHEAFLFSAHAAQNRAEVSDICQSRQEALDLVNGPVFAVDLFDVVDDKQVILLSCHHAVIDLVSWRIIWGDIEDYVDNGNLLATKTTSFRKWCRRQLRVGSQLSPLEVLPYAVPEVPADFWGLSAADNTCAPSDGVTVGQSLDKQVTGMLFTDCNNALNTEPIDIIVASLAYSFAKLFPERTLPTVWVEGHGREQPEHLTLDVTSTVGWFTTLHPRPIPIGEADSLIHAIRLAKDRRKQIPHKGQPYFSCRYNSESGRRAYMPHGDPEILLNFVGQYQQLEGDEGLFRRAENVDYAETSSSSLRSTMIDISAEVEEGQFAVSFGYHRKMRFQDRLAAWPMLFEETIRAAVDDLMKLAPSFTVADLPLLSLNGYDALDVLMESELPSLGINSRNVVDMYPCSSLQNGILISMQKDAASYSTYSVYTCGSNNGEPICPLRLQDAWRDTVRRHTVLQTVFALHPDGDSFIQILLSKVEPRITLVPCGNDAPSSVLEKLPSPIFSANEPHHALYVGQSTNGSVSMRLDLSHTLIDAASGSVLLQDMANAYDGRPAAESPPFRDLILHIQSVTKSQRLASWEKLLRGVKPCIVLDPMAPTPFSAQNQLICHDAIAIPSPVFEGVAEFCKRASITKSVFLHMAWAMTLSQFTGSDDVCFAYLINGRDAPIDHINNMVGPLANLLIGRVQLNHPAAHVISRASSDSIQHMRIQHVSLADLQHQLGISGRMLNTAISLRGNDKTKEAQNSSINFEAGEEEDQHEFDLDLTANIDGMDMDAMVSYRRPFITKTTAEAFTKTFVSAVRCLLREQPELNADEDELALAPLYDSFFEQSFGAKEDAMRSYWQQQLSDSEAAAFPSMPQGYVPKLDGQSESLSVPVHKTMGVDDATLLSAAWFLLQCKMTSTNETIFGVSNSHVKSPLPIRLALTKGMTAEALLAMVQDQQSELAKYQQTPAWFIRSLGAAASEATEFAILLKETSSAEENHTQPLALAVEYQRDTVQGGLRFSIRHDASIITEVESNRYVALLEHILRQLTSEACRAMPVEHLDMLPASALREIWSWNDVVPEATPECIHSMISAMAVQQPHAPAIHGWDGDLTYREFDELSSKLAAQLQNAGVCKGQIVPLLFEKSKWTSVAAVAVIKTGAAVVATDPSTQPTERLATIVNQVHGKLCLASASLAELASSLCERVITVGPALADDVANTSALAPVQVHPDDLLYINFTSGSTGVPKGAMISHSNFSTAIHYQREVLGYFKEARVLDFASYAFDVWWSNLFNTLTVGACLCIPSADERQNELGAALVKYNVTLADITPTTARLIPGLDHLSSLLLGGEVVLASDAALAPRTYVTNSYGPAECTPVSTAIDMALDEPGIGRGYGVCTWIVDPEDPTKLSPLGAPGELWLEGPIVGQGYLGDAERTAASFVQDPIWLTSGPGGRRGRLYRTGDLVQYSSSGTLLFHGRKDTQVKIRGQRIELEEIENGVVKVLLADNDDIQAQVVVEVVERKDTGNKLLVAFVSLPSAAGKDQHEHDQLVKDATSGLQDKLRAVLPIYGVPSIFIPTQTIPMTPTDKVDRRKLRTVAAQMSSEEMTLLSRDDGVVTEPRTEEERILRQLWAKVLHVDEATISVDDGFFRVGGDSIGAMKLVGMARKMGMTKLTVKDVFSQPVLQDMARLCVSAVSSA